MTRSLPTGPARLVLLAAALWVLLPFTTGELLGQALHDTSTPFRTVVSTAAWVLWATILAATVVPRPVGLTAARLGMTGGGVVAVWAAVDVAADPDPSTATVVLGVIVALAAVAVIVLPGVADRFVDGVSYGDERRFVLRAPGPVLVTVLLPATAIVLVGLTTGPLLLADEQWILGAVLTVVGFAAAWFPLLALHRLTSRFVVFVPNGFVVHDPTVLREPVLFVGREIASLAPARADTAARDLTAGALGLALELQLAEPVELPFVTGRATTENERARALLVSPTRPGAVLRTAVERGLPVA